MDELSLILILAPIVLLAYTTEAFTGFGASVIAVTLGAHFYPIEKLVPVIVLLNVGVAAYIGIKYRRFADKDLLLKRILPLMGLGLAIGVVLFPYVKGMALKLMLGIFVTIFAVRQLVLLRSSETGGPPISSWRAAAFQVLAGITHAFFSTGGPPLVYSLGRMALPKHVFRATLSLVWLVLSISLVIIFSIDGRLNQESLTLFLALSPTLPLGILFGEFLHGRANDRYFRITIYVLLLFSGIVLMF